MFGLVKPKLPVTLEQKKWVDDSFLHLASLLGADRFFRASVILPTPQHFPDPYDRSESALRSMFGRVASHMQVDPNEIDVSIVASGDKITSTLVPFYSGSSSSAAGLYHHDPAARSHISVEQELLKDPMGLVAVLAHELGHIILLRPGLVGRDEPDMEPLNDLLTIFLGFGIFTANSAFRFEQHTSPMSQGWSTQRLGYLSEQQLGYALARFAYERGEKKPTWASFVTTNIAGHMKRSLGWLANQREPFLFSRVSQ